jgi:hypothetical protein
VHIVLQLTTLHLYVNAASDIYGKLIILKTHGHFINALPTLLHKQNNSSASTVCWMLSYFNAFVTIHNMTTSVHSICQLAAHWARHCNARKRGT